MRYASVDFTRMLIPRTWTLLLVQTHPPPPKKNQQKKNQERTTLSQLMIVILAIAFQTDIHVIETF